jgi:endonuclease YncB( thermonuclease family)
MDANRSFIIAPDLPTTNDVAEMLQAEVMKVFDGDGFLARVWHPERENWVPGVPCRFAFIDAPEMRQPLGTEAEAFLQQLIGGKTLKLAPIGKESSGYLPIDGYKRMLCMGYLTEEMPTGEVQYFKDGKCRVGVVKRARPVTRNVELEMVINGWAWVMKQYAFDREDEYFAAEEDARRERRGIWAMGKPEPPWAFKQKEKRRQMAAKLQAGLFDRDS